MDLQDHEVDEFGEQDFEELPLGLWGSGFSHFEINQLSKNTPEEHQTDVTVIGSKHLSEDIESLIDGYYPEEVEPEECAGLWSYPILTEQRNIHIYEKQTDHTLAPSEAIEMAEDYDEDSLPLWLTPIFDISLSEKKIGYQAIQANKDLLEYDGEQDFVGTKKYFERIQTTSHK